MSNDNTKNKPTNGDNAGSQLSAHALDMLLRFRRVTIVLVHVFAFAAALGLSFLIVRNMQIRKDWLLYQFPLLLLFMLPIKLIVFGLFKQYRGWWRYVGISDLLGIFRASLLSTMIIVLLWYGLFNISALQKFHWGFEKLSGVGDGVILLDFFTTMMFLGGLRMVVRLYNEEFNSESTVGLKRFIIIGAGDAGEALLRETLRMKAQQYEMVGFVDDDPHKQGMSIHGINVLGTVEQLPKICEKYNVEEIAIALPGSDRQQLRRVVQICQGTKIRFRTVPSITDIASGKLKVSQIRDVDINDLLGRDVIELELDKIEGFLKDKVILVTGAGGSIGSEMCRQVCQFGPKQLLLVELAENPLFHIERELLRDYPDVPMKAIICNISDRFRVKEVFAKYKPEVVIHAAAHKHVPLMETNPGESIKNNVVGTKNIADASDENGVNNFVMISTDKAVNPTSLMGSSKRVAEMYVQDINTTSDTHFVTVRFGNVLGSNGSVIPIFKKQIARGGPVTVTHPDMERYFMTIPEASQLVLQAATLGKGGEIFVLDMGESVKIVHLARELITLSGFRPDEDIEIKFSGMRPGEKLFEELSIKGEDMQSTRHPKIGIWKNIPKDRISLRNGIEELVKIAQTQDHAKVVLAIKNLIPEYIGKELNQ
jgi:FlaA1/EpsC-like NDP-sugar epimerase